ncbi:ABC transporter substrate-binding protein [Kaistia nematophila]|uniref:ABC transporter substrate-binding protein n=1 Tax=Kaistia nematophila TaxID=2994654 RepID=A0A9X3E1Y2_9HYPH|nr:ABC transporter substrate-binding protein [Kaistia nematophila]
MPSFAQDVTETLVVAGPRTPESLELDYPSTEAVQEARKNVYERLLAYEMVKNEDGVMVENFDKLVGALAESWEVSPDRTSITFKLRPAKSHAGNTLTADDVMWTFKRGWDLKATFYWYMHQMLKIQDFDTAFQKIDDMTVKVQLPGPSPLIERLWVNSDLGIIDATEVKKHLTDADPVGQTWLSTNTASYSPYKVTTYTPGREIVYEANDDYYRGAPKLKKVIFREIPNSSNRVAALQAGSIDVAEWLLPRELDLLSKAPKVKVEKVFGNYIHRIDLNNTIEPFTNPKVRQALNYLVPRDQIGKAIYFGTARQTKSPVSEIYPGYTDEFFAYSEDVEKAKALLTEAGLAEGFKTELGYRTGDEIEEQIAVILKTAFARAGIDVQLNKLPSSTLVERYSKGTIPMYFLRDMAIVPDAAYVTNLWLNSASMVDFSRFKNEEVDKLIDKNLTATDEAARLADMKRVQELVVENAPWVFLFNPGYQLALRDNIKGYSWYTPNGNAWFDFHKE